MSEAFELAPAMYETIHELRRTRDGIQYLEQTGRMKDYMKKRLSIKEREFISWDGEGWTDTDGEHYYMLLQCVTGDHIEYPRLSSVGCLELMLKVAGEHRKAHHVIYGGGYDITHILRDMPYEMRLSVMEGDRVRWEVPASESHRANTFTIEYLPHKWFILSGMDWNSGRHVTMKLFDVMTFFQTSFVKALESRGLEVPELVVSGKASRAEFTFADLDAIKLYCQQELELLVMLCNKLRDEFNEAGITVTQYHGPGAVASAVFKAYGVRKAMNPPPLHIERAAQGAYFGGRFERFKAGHYDGKVYQYDINSAYPYQIANLPNLAGCTWRATFQFEPGKPGVWYCHYTDPNKRYVMPHPVPWRGRGGIVGFPAYVDGVWLWTAEVEAGLRTGNLHVERGYVLETVNDQKPFAFVEGMYRKRKEWKKAGRGGERALKLALNSLYGKMAQRVGGSEKYGGRPPWHQLEWAGMVTSGTRAMIWDAIMQAPNEIIAVETDSVMSRVPLNLDCGPELGQWEATQYDWVTYVQSGVYFTSGDDSGMKAKSRGIDITQLDHDEVMRYLASDRLEPILIKSRQFIAIGNPQTHFYGQWIDSVKELSVNEAGKRIHIPAFCDACAQGLTMADTLHDMVATPYYGSTPSERHSLPWLDDIHVPLHDMGRVDEPIEEWQ